MAAESERTIYALALLYIACSHSTDGVLNQTEVDAVSERIAKWRPNATPAEIGAVLAKSLELYQSLSDQADELRQVGAAATIVRRELGEDRIPDVMADLRIITEADGIVSFGEDEVLNTVRKVFGLD